MARNEEKQLARLNRLYLQQQKEEELKKRPPRPKLATLNTVEDVKKWLPTVVRDIDFYVKQMEVTCYPQHQIEEFEHRIDRLRGEYKAFIHKIHQLEPDWKTTPWGDRPYSGKLRKMDASTCSESRQDAVEKDSDNPEDQQDSDSSNLKTFVPLRTPVLKKSSLCSNWYGFEKPKDPDLHESEIQMQNEPLHFESGKKLPECARFEAVQWPDNCSKFSKDECNRQVIGTFKSCEGLGDGDPEADFLGDLTDAKMASTLQHYSTSPTTHLQKCHLNTVQLHAVTDSEQITRKCAFEKVSVKNSCVSSLNDSSGVSVLGSLNIPYTDSSSSDAET